VTDGARARLARQLAIPVTELTVLDRFADADADRLAAVTAEAVARQTRELDVALERALGFVPALLRGRARKLLFPGDRRG
jgi:hypothetical protein